MMLYLFLPTVLSLQPNVQVCSSQVTRELGILQGKMGDKHNTVWLILLTQFLVLFAKIIGAKVPAIIVFGDSSVDAGNNNWIPTIARSNFEPYGRDFKGGKPTGRFSNGRIASDFISEALGLKPMIPAYLDPAYSISDFATGVTFASAGTGYDNATSGVLSVIPLWKELEYYKEYQKKLRAYLGGTQADQTISEALHMISLGTNDFLENYYSLPGGRSSQFTITQYEDFLIGIARNFISSLYGLGARKISLGGLPPMGCLPLERATNIMGGNDCREKYNTVALEFNDKLKQLTIALNKELSGINLVFSNPYYIFMNIIRKPSLFGFEVASVACCATGMFEMGYTCNRNNLLTCSDADKYVFWDAFHPTQKTNSIIADYVVNKLMRQEEVQAFLPAHQAGGEAFLPAHQAGGEAFLPAYQAGGGPSTQFLLFCNDYFLVASLLNIFLYQLLDF